MKAKNQTEPTAELLPSLDKETVAPRPFRENKSNKPTRIIVAVFAATALAIALGLGIAAYANSDSQASLWSSAASPPSASQGTISRAPVMVSGEAEFAGIASRDEAAAALASVSGARINTTNPAWLHLRPLMSQLMSQRS